ncbi:RNA methyltransferase [Tepidiphilus olei]|uniref:RNA methyltransferase n=1 Tax=Tepidiphilus olei TaxID=2502184 RepID=UPI00115E11BC|nr:RNA methyltransferase [Tepidiphilus olei]
MVDHEGARSLARVRVVLCRPSHPGNIGAAARAMKTMGLSHLVLVAPRCFPDAEATARASGAVDVLERAVVVDTLAEALAGTAVSVAFTTRSRTYVQPFRTPEESASEVLEVLQAVPDAQAALVFGNETNGLTNEEVWQCTFPATIPANPEYSSLNLAAAVQVACYVLARTCEAFAPQASAIADAPDFVPASHEAVEGLLAQWLTVLERLDFYDPAAPKRLEARLRRLLARARLERAELDILRGMLKAVVRKIP